MSNIRVLKALFVETGTYNDMMMRPYSAHIDGALVNEFNDLTRTGLNLTAPGVAGIAGKILQPSVAPAGAGIIENGWGERRIRFFIEFGITSALGMQREVVSGFTDHMGATVSGNIDPMMRCYLNSVVNLRSIQENTSYGTTYRSSVSDSSHILCPQKNESFSAVNQADMRRTMRPEDVIAVMSVNNVTQDMGAVRYDMRSTFCDGPKKSRRSNGLPARYISKVITALADGHNTPDVYVDQATEAYESARDMTRESPVCEDRVISILTQNTGYRFEGFVTFDDLTRCFPDLEQNSVFMIRGNMQRNTHREATRGDTEHWHGSTLETIAATILSNAVPATMMDLMISRISFIATNRTLDGSVQVRINDSAFLTEGIDMTPYLNGFIARLQSEVLMDVSKYNQMDFAVTMTVDVLGDTYISISINGSPDTEYCIPSFCDALLAPVLAVGSAPLDKMAYSLDQFFTQSKHTNGISPVATAPHLHVENHIHRGNNNGPAAFSSDI